jgi:hypothetical protein
MKKRKINRKRKKYTKNDVRTLAILSLIEGAVLQAKMSADPLTFNRVEYARQHCQIATNNWYIHGSEAATIKRVLAALAAIGKKLDSLWWLKANAKMNVPGMIYISMQLLDDLEASVKQAKRRRMLQNILDALTVLVDHIDPEGAMILTQDRAKEVVDLIYEVVGEK